MAQMVKNLPATQETWVWSLGQEDPLENEMAPHSSILAWRIPWTEKPSRLQSMGSQRVGHDWATSLSLNGLREIKGLLKVTQRVSGRAGFWAQFDLTFLFGAVKGCWPEGSEIQTHCQASFFSTRTFPLTQTLSTPSRQFPSGFSELSGRT